MLLGVGKLAKPPVFETGVLEVRSLPPEPRFLGAMDSTTVFETVDVSSTLAGST